LRGEPIREGRTAFFDRSGRLVHEENWREGELQGPWTTWYTSGKVRERGQYRLGRMDGTWENFDELGRPTLRANYARGVPDGEWQRFEQGKVACTIRFEQGEATQVNGLAFDDPLGHAYRRGEIDNEVVRNAVTSTTLMGFSKNARIKHFAEFVMTIGRANVLMDRKCAPQANRPLLTIQIDRLTVGALLVLQCQPHDLVATYRYGTIWITTKEDAQNWVDRTGISELLSAPPTEVSSVELKKVQASLQRPIKYLDFLDTPMAEAAKFITDNYDLRLECDPGLSDISLTSSLGGTSLQNGLGILCDQNDLRIRWKDGETLVIEAQESPR
jgi:hypothetical protein